MTRTSATRSVSAILAVLALGISAPVAGAKQIDTGPTVPFVAASPSPSLANSPSATSHHGGGATSEWEIVAVASGAASLALFGVGVTLLATRRRRERRTAGPPTVAA
ncbi:MAG TPA: hypothetical protein VJU80_11555 [Solirubrobacteraceae bacterium]|nr:hypothetical protein [Solirubrobacteraceae bacterium]